MKMEYISSVGPKGQITLPAKLRRELGIKVKDLMVIEREDGQIVVRPYVSALREYAGKAGRLKEPMSWEEIARTVGDEVAERVAREGQE